MQVKTYVRYLFHLNNTTYVIKNFFVALLLTVTFTCNAFANAKTYYIVDDTSLNYYPYTPGTNLGADGTSNLPNGNNNNGFIRTTFSTSAPSGSNTQIRNGVSGSNNWTLLGRVYTTPVYSGATQVTTSSGGDNGTVWLRSRNSNGVFQFYLVDYDTSTASAGNRSTGVQAYTDTINVYNSSSPNSYTLNFKNVNRVFTIPSGHRLALEIWYKAAESGGNGRLYCNSYSYRSHIDVDEQPTTSSRTITVKVGAGGSVTRTSINPAVNMSGPTPPSASLTAYTHSLNNNSTDTFTITASTGYRLSDVTEDKGYGAVSIKSQMVGNGLTRSNITEDRVLTFTFETVPTYQINASVSGSGGSIASPPGAGIKTVNQGDSVSYAFQPLTGYRVSDVKIDGTSIGAVASYPFTNIQADHTLDVSFEVSPDINNYCSIPAFLGNEIPPNVMIMLSVETPMTGVGNPKIDCTGLPSSMSFACGQQLDSACPSNKALGCYDDSKDYYGYFESGKCYTYSGSGSSGLFSPSGAVTSGTHQCSGAWSGNLLNWATSMAMDSFRKAFTGGNRDVDEAGNTVLMAGLQPYNYSWYPEYIKITNAGNYTQSYSGTIYLKRHAVGFSVCKSGATSCTVADSGTDEHKFPTSTTSADAYSLRIKACDATGGIEARCNPDNNKPEGTLQKYADKMRFGLISYTTDNSADRDGGILRSNVKWLGPKIKYGMEYNNGPGTGAPVLCETLGGCNNPEKEIKTDGTFYHNPDNVSNPDDTSARSGVINYINKFGYYSGNYKSLDPVSEMYYEVVRYFMNKSPSGWKYCDSLGTTDDGFPVYCNADKASSLGWRDPFIYPCSQSFVIAINDANPWNDKRIPGTPFGSTTSGGGDASDYCNGNSSHPCDNDVPILSDSWPSAAAAAAGLSSAPGSEFWTNKVGHDEGITNLSVGCIWGTSGCVGGTDVTDKLGRVIRERGDTYYISGLSYFAHMNDLRSDLDGKQTLTTYMIDTQEPKDSMSVGPRNQLYLAAKYGGFDDKDGNGKPYRNTSTTDGCGGVSDTPNISCSEWDADNDGYPDNYFFASDSSLIENGLNTSFKDMLRHTASGTAASILSNSAGNGASMLQAVFYPLEYFNNGTKASWTGELQNFWYYLDPYINNSSIREDTDYVSGTHELNLANDLIARFQFDGNQTTVLLYKDSNGDGVEDSPQPSGYPLEKSLENVKSIWKAGQLLWERDLDQNPRTLYTTIDGESRTALSNLNTSCSSDARVKGLLQAGSCTEAANIINYTEGKDVSGYRSRTVNWKNSHGATLNAVWKLGDIISSTPRIQSTTPLNSYQKSPSAGYNDTSYSSFINSSNYRNRGMAYVGANDGMLHAFKLGKLNNEQNGTIEATLSGLNLGSEQWAYIPRNVLPYLKYYTDVKYDHIYSVDGTTIINDMSINKPSGCTESHYWNCAKNGIDNWATVLIGSMGLGGASASSTDEDCTNCVRTPTTDPDHPSKGLGYSSYFALDVTRQDFTSTTDNTLTTSYTSPETGSSVNTPRLLWEFSDPDLGYTTPGIAVVRIKSKTDTSLTSKNGRWLGVIPSGPTGPINLTSHQFMGRSDQHLYIFVIDLKTGEPLHKYDTGIDKAFAGPVTNGVIDTDRWKLTQPGNYQDDAVYIGYTKAATGGTGDDWIEGGVLRLVIPENTDPDNIDFDKWKISTVINGTGPVTTNITKLQDRKNHNLWLYFGTGRYFFNRDTPANPQRLYGVRDLCYKADVNRTCHSTASDNTSSSDDIDDCLCANPSGTINASTPPDPSVPILDAASLTNQSGTGASDSLSSDNGWYVNLSNSVDGYDAERNVTDPLALSNGVVYFTTFMPTNNICHFGGNTYIWAFKYDTGYTPPSSSLEGKLLIQTSTGAMVEKDLSNIFNDPNQLGRKTSEPIVGKPPGDPPAIISKSGLKPVKKILHILER